MLFILIIGLIIFIFGASIGSFLSAAVYRMQKKESMFGRSHCPMCGYKLGFFDLFPIFSFLCLKGKCRRCFKSIDIEYFLTEIICGLIFVFSFFYRWVNSSGADDFSLIILRDWLFFSGLIFIFIYDFKYQIIPDAVSVPFIILLFGINYFLGMRWQDLALAVVIGGGFFLIQYLLSRGKWVGGGDIRLGALLGAGLGFPGIILALFVAYTIGGFVGVYLILRKKKEMKSKIAFGTFLAVGGVVALFWGEKIINWYWNLL